MHSTLTTVAEAAAHQILAIGNQSYGCMSCEGGCATIVYQQRELNSGRADVPISTCKRSGVRCLGREECFHQHEPKTWMR